MNKRPRVWLTALTVLVDLGMAALAYYLAYELRTNVPIPTELHLAPFRVYLRQMVIHVLSVGGVFFFYRLYHMQSTSRIDLGYRIVSAVSIATLLATALSFLTLHTDQGFTRGLIIYDWALSIVLIMVGRIITRRFERYVRHQDPQRLLLVGTGQVARMILQKTISSPVGYRLVGFVGPSDGPSDVAGLPVLGTQSDLGQLIREYSVDEVIIALPDASHEDLMDLVAVCEVERAAVRIFPDLFQIMASEVAISDLDGLPMLSVRDVALRGWKRSLKRAMDLVVSAVALVLLSPFLMLIAGLVRLESPGSVFYAQERVGLDGKPFPMLKFRSMRQDAEQQSGPVWATADDPRKTRIGSILRRTSLDELPQLINVLLGEMSLVGPRPERPVFVEQFRQVVPRYMERHAEKAGMTGWAQVNGLRGDTSIVERTKYDLYYVENWSFLFDVKIMVRTVVNLLRGDRNAY
ncbi:MAG: undecaprenyl-phosphate glucose phosphotransferase [Anaerolineae bacterium]|jgi:exopolysaccharide biosynthesis polyprenyl glycosylphosphotransferase|nr:undecaprenyl-phosphate glucose phosphotransferase [Chloroflexota bacterium]